MSSQDMIKLRLSEDNHKTLVGSYEQPDDLVYKSASYWREDKQPIFTEFVPTPFKQREIAKLFIEIGQKLLEGKDIQWLEIKSNIRQSPKNMAQIFEMKLDYWESE